jgi:integrase
VAGDGTGPRDLLVTRGGAREAAGRRAGLLVQAHPRTYVKPDEDAWVFLGPNGARPTRNNFHTIWDKARRAAGIPDLHLHDLRHTGNTLAAETGTTLRELMDRMGHASTRRR